MNDKGYQNEIIQRIYADKLLCDLFLILFNMKMIVPQGIAVDHRLYCALHYIHVKLPQWILVDDLIEVSGYSKTAFYRIFKNRMKVSPREYIETERFKIASTLLLEGKKVKDVAKTIGFQDVSYFDRVFRRKYGVTPGEHKQKINNSTGSFYESDQKKFGYRMDAI